MWSAKWGALLPLRGPIEMDVREYMYAVCGGDKTNIHIAPLLLHAAGFKDAGTVTVMRSGKEPLELEYRYNIRKDNLNSLTLQSLSTTAETVMKVNGSYIPEYQMYVNYYGAYDYGDQWISAAAAGNHTGFASKYVYWVLPVQRVALGLVGV
jgi:hypothetical protein